MSEQTPETQEGEGFQWSAFENNLESQISWWRRNKEDGIEGAEDLFGAYELGYSVENILSLIREAAESGQAKSIMMLGEIEFWKGSEYSSRVLKRFPPIVRKKGFDAVVIKELANRIGVLPRRTPDTVIFRRHLSNYEPTGTEEEVTYNILPVKSVSVPKNTYWHELVKGLAAVGNPSSALITVNKFYIPTTSNNSQINRIRLKLQGI